ncbi:hypothetical protein GBN24_11965 [Plesiomonas shigelloides]|uniref:hypothetical protein n=1 Tax=Plesiomonas shigelloides TaxID=703 RepID=UPI0012617122|nr:hypothetical protein [Plesiomonas shigelloides]KAB7688997.1 hypothetical protein GBN24_11965 [Plesiomonas shigelloides]
MQIDKAVKYIRKLIVEAEKIDPGSPKAHSLAARAKEFFRVYIGDESEFYTSLLFLDDKNPDKDAISNILIGFLEFVEEGFVEDFTPLQQAEDNIVSDFLEQARVLLNDKKVHPAAAIVLIGATLEEFLAKWVKRENVKMGNLKAGISNYAKKLYENKLLTSQDSKDILAWAGLRNEAAHGKWDEISNRERAKIMLESVNLFVRRYGAEEN